MDCERVCCLLDLSNWLRNKNSIVMFDEWLTASDLARKWWESALQSPGGNPSNRAATLVPSVWNCRCNPFAPSPPLAFSLSQDRVDSVSEIPVCIKVLAADQSNFFKATYSRRDRRKWRSSMVYFWLQIFFKVATRWGEGINKRFGGSTSASSGSLCV